MRSDTSPSGILDCLKSLSHFGSPEIDCTQNLLMGASYSEKWSPFRRSVTKPATSGTIPK